jgi:hypothetical protein
MEWEGGKSGWEGSAAKISGPSYPYLFYELLPAFKDNWQEDAIAYRQLLVGWFSWQ